MSLKRFGVASLLPVTLCAASLALCAQEETKRSSETGSLRRADSGVEGGATVEPGTHIPLSVIKSVSTKQSEEGDRVYLESVFPIMVNGKIVIPPGSYVAGTLTEVKRPGRIKGKGNLFLRFDYLILPNGVTRNFRGRIGTLDGRAGETLDKTEGKIKGEGNKGGDARTVGEASAAGASVGAIAGSAAGHVGMGAGIGAAAGATAGMLGVLLSRGPEVMLAQGSTIEMVLDQPLQFSEAELDFSNAKLRPTTINSGGGPQTPQRQRGLPLPGRRFPY